jgi:hypothetical protein
MAFFRHFFGDFFFKGIFDRINIKIISPDHENLPPKNTLLDIWEKDEERKVCCLTFEHISLVMIMGGSSFLFFYFFIIFFPLLRIWKKIPKNLVKSRKIQKKIPKFFVPKKEGQQLVGKKRHWLGSKTDFLTEKRADVFTLLSL